LDLRGFGDDCVARKTSLGLLEGSGRVKDARSAPLCGNLGFAEVFLDTP
jgi:hypothetical protein